MRLVVRLVVTRVDAGGESILTQVKSDNFSPDHLDDLVNSCLSEGLKASGSEVRTLRSWDPEVSVLLATDDDDGYVRPSLHLNINTIQRLADIGATFDFDPYV